MDEKKGCCRPPKNLPTEERIIRYLSHCAHFLRHQTEGKGSQRRVLLHLRKHGPLSQREILDEMGVRASSLSELLSKLEGKGLIIKEKSETDKRNYNVSITPAGLEVLEELQRQYHASMADLLSGFPEEDKAELNRLLDKLNALWQE